MLNKWIKITDSIPEKEQKVYYFSKNIGMFRGEYHYIESSYANPHKFMSDHGVVDSNDISHWMPYDHNYRNMIPLPPDYDTTTNFDEIIKTQEKQLTFIGITYGDIP